MKTYEPPCCGDTMHERAVQIATMAFMSNEVVKTKFNGIELTANPNDEPEAIVKFYRNEHNRRQEESSKLLESKGKQPKT